MTKKIKWLLFGSLTANFVFVLFVAAFIYKKGGIDYIKEKFSSHKEPVKVEKKETERSYFYNLLTNIYKDLPSDKEEIIFLGDSHFQLVPWREMLKDKRIKNRGIGGDNLIGLIDRVEAEISNKTSAVFICAGTNDINENKSSEFIVDSFNSLITKISTKFPSVRIKVLSILPLGKDYSDSKAKNEKIKEINDILMQLESGKKFDLINIYQHFANNQNNLKPEYSYDNIHLNAEGYRTVGKILSENLK